MFQSLGCCAGKKRSRVGGEKGGWLGGLPGSCWWLMVARACVVPSGPTRDVPEGRIMGYAYCPLYLEISLCPLCLLTQIRAPGYPFPALRTSYPAHQSGLSTL